MYPKSIFASKTLWFNILAGVVVIFWQNISPMLPLTAEQSAGVVVLGNMILRMITTQPVTLK